MSSIYIQKYFSKHAPIQTLYQSYLYNYSKPISIFDQLNVPLVLSTLKHLISSAIWIPFISFILTFYFFLSRFNSYYTIKTTCFDQSIFIAFTKKYCIYIYVFRVGVCVLSIISYGIHVQQKFPYTSLLTYYTIIIHS